MKSLLKNSFIKTVLFNYKQCRLCSLSVQGKFTNYGDNDEEHGLKQKLLKVAIIGVPNSGKSTLINSLMDRKVCPTSNKVHTTRAKASAVFTEEDTQIVFLDTPGLVNERERKRHNLERSFAKDSKNSFREADSVGVLHDVSSAWTRDKLDIKVIRLLQEHKNIPSFLILNKIDLLKSKRMLLDITTSITAENSNDVEEFIKQGKRNVSGHVFSWPHFEEIFMVSALTGDGLTDIRNYLKRCAKPNKWIYPEDVWSDQKPEAVIVNAVKAKLLDFLPQEIPYSLKPVLELFEQNDEGVITTVVIIECPSTRIANLIAGVSDGRLRQITASLQQDLQNAFQNFVRIRLVLHSKEKK